MKARRLILLGMLVLAAVMPLSQARASYGYTSGIEVRQVSDFYEPLAPFGYWTEVPRYGWCWYPTNVEQGWRPYINGNWVWSDGGWYWASEEPWAWATYHYGRWVWDPYYGWLWVPGLEWAPAWVAWREGGDYVGWAPLPPECDFGPGANVIYAPQVVIAPQYFVFVQQVNFCNIIRPHCVVNDPAICKRTVNITNINRVNHCVVNRGPAFETIERSNPGRVQRARIERPSPQQAANTRTGPEIIRGSRRQGDNAPVAPPPETVVDRRADRPRSGASTQEERPKTDIREKVKQRTFDQQTVVVHQLPPRASSQKQTTAAAVQNQPAATGDTAPTQSEARRQREERTRPSQRAETVADQPNLNTSARAAQISLAR